MVGSVLVRAARQQGQRRLLAWRQALAELLPWQLAEQQQEQQQQGQGHPFQQEEEQGQRQGRHFSARAAGWLPLRQQPLVAGGSDYLSKLVLPATAQSSWQQQMAVQSAAGILQQFRGFAITTKGYRPRRKDVAPDRNLPDRNEQIRAPEVRVVFPVEQEKAAEVMTMKQALKLARADGLDVVMVSHKAEPPVVRLVEWSKVLYEQQKREKAASKAKAAQAKAAEAKEVRIGCQIAEHDLAVKMAQARRFLEEGYHLRLVVTFKGGQQIALGREVTLYLIGQLADLCKVKDEKHLQRPQRGQWAVMLAPLTLPAAGHKAAAAAKKTHQHTQHYEGQGEQQQVAPVKAEAVASTAEQPPLQ